MRTFSHWTPRYVKNRIATIYYEKTNRGDPWLTHSANRILDSYLTTSDVGLEFGSGRSTVWFAKHVAHLTSVEDNKLWAHNVRTMLEKENVENVTYLFLPASDATAQDNQEYVRVIDGFEDESLDFCLVDGQYREFCALKVIEKLRAGGILIIDNVNWFLPCVSHAPNSRSIAEGPRGPVWSEVAQHIDSWRRIWTTNGVWDTALFFKPSN